MKSKFKLIMLAFLFPIICCGQNLLNTPQKVVIDKKRGRVGFTRNRLLVSNYRTGSIVQIDTAGNQSFFVQGAGFIDGLEIVDNVVYGIGNNRYVYGYNLDTKQQVLNLKIEGTGTDYLSSITYDSVGHLFISCPNLNEIYRLRISDYSYWIFAKDNGLNRPNGILLEKEKDRIVTIDDCPSPSLIHAISLTDSTVSTLATTSFNNPDGITRDKYGYHYIGGYYLPGLYITDADFSYHPQLFFEGNNMVYPTYDADDHSLLITYYEDNSWGRVPLTTTASSENIQQNKCILHPVYPNPSNSGVTIRFEMGTRAHVNMEVYNSAGILVSTLVNDEIDPGIHSVMWNGKDHAGKPASKGVYFIRLAMGGDVLTKKAMLLN